MNPFSEYNFLKSDHISFDYGSLITVLSPAGHGKSVVINSMILEYIKNNVDVLIFSENVKSNLRLYDTINFLQLENGCKNTGLCILRDSNFYVEENYFIESLIDFLRTRLYKEKRFVIVFDCGISLKMFDKIPNALVCTRRVLIEKVNQKSSFFNLPFSMFVPDDNRRYILEGKFREIANYFNSQIITTNNIRRNFEEKENFNIAYREIMQQDIAFLVTKKEQEFKLKTLKNRFGVENQLKSCKINVENLTLEVKK